MILTPRQKLVLTLVAKCKLSQSAVAQRLGISEPAVSQLYGRAKAAMRRLAGDCPELQEDVLIDVVLN